MTSPAPHTRVHHRVPPPLRLHRKGWGPATALNLSRWLLLTTVLLLVPPIHAQGCAQCLDSTRATPPQVQAAYRHAIYLLCGFASTLFITGTLLLRKHR